MSWAEQLRDLLTIVTRLDHTIKSLEREREERRQFEERIAGRLHELDQRVQGLAERLAGLEAARQADRREFEAVLEKFDYRVERAALRLGLSDSHRPLPGYPGRDDVPTSDPDR